MKRGGVWWSFGSRATFLKQDEHLCVPQPAPGRDVELSSGITFGISRGSVPIEVLLATYDFICSE